MEITKANVNVTVERERLVKGEVRAVLSSPPEGTLDNSFQAGGVLFVFTGNPTAPTLSTFNTRDGKELGEPVQLGRGYTAGELKAVYDRWIGSISETERKQNFVRPAIAFGEIFKRGLFELQVEDLEHADSIIKDSYTQWSNTFSDTLAEIPHDKVLIRHQITKIEPLKGDTIRVWSGTRHKDYTISAKNNHIEGILDNSSSMRSGDKLSYREQMELFVKVSENGFFIGHPVVFRDGQPSFVRGDHACVAARDKNILNTDAALIVADSKLGSISSYEDPNMFNIPMAYAKTKSLEPACTIQVEGKIQGINSDPSGTLIFCLMEGVDAKSKDILILHRNGLTPVGSLEGVGSLPIFGEGKGPNYIIDKDGKVKELLLTPSPQDPELVRMMRRSPREELKELSEIVKRLGIRPEDAMKVIIAGQKAMGVTRDPGRLEQLIRDASF